MTGLLLLLNADINTSITAVDGRIRFSASGLTTVGRSTGTAVQSAAASRHFAQPSPHADPLLRFVRPRFRFPRASPRPSRFLVRLADSFRRRRCRSIDWPAARMPVSGIVLFVRFGFIFA